MKESTSTLVTPHLITIAELATAAEGGADVTQRLQQVVAEAVEDFNHVYDARGVIRAFIHSLEVLGQEAKAERRIYAMILLRAAAMADRQAQGPG